MSWLWQNLDLVLGLSAQHLRLSAIPILAGPVIAIPLGRLAQRVRVARPVLLTAFNVLFTIPSLALFVLLPLILGTRILDDLNVLAALTIYAVAMMLRGTVDAFDGTSSAVRQAATAIGYSPSRRFWTVELPLAGPVLLANLRVVSVCTVSLLSVAALIGKGGLGYLFTNGFQRDFPTEIGIGVAAVLVIALGFDLILVGAGRLLLPWTRTADGAGRARTRHPEPTTAGAVA